MRGFRTRSIDQHLFTKSQDSRNMYPLLTQFYINTSRKSFDPLVTKNLCRTQNKISLNSLLSKMIPLARTFKRKPIPPRPLPMLRFLYALDTTDTSRPSSISDMARRIINKLCPYTL